MKMASRLLLKAASAALLIGCVSSPAVAQWQTPDHSIPVGAGKGTGFKFAAPGASGQALVSTGSTSDPTFRILSAADLSNGVTGSGAIVLDTGATLNPKNIGMVLYASQFGAADWCANLDLAIAALNGNSGTILVTDSAGSTACSGTGDIAIPNGVAVRIMGGENYSLNRAISFANGSTFYGVGGGIGALGATIPGGPIITWNGANGGVMLRFFDAVQSRFGGLTLDCGTSANCIPVVLDSDNNPPSTQNVFENFSLKRFTTGILIGLPGTSHPTVSACNSNSSQPGCYEMDFLTVRNFQMLGGCRSTDVGVHINSMNALQASKIERGNIKCVGIAIHQIFSNPQGTTILENVTNGSMSGGTPVFYRVESGAPSTFTLIGNETESTGYSVWDSACGVANQSTLWISNGWNQKVLIDGCDRVTSISNSGSSGFGTNDWVVGGSASVYSVNDSVINAWDATGSGVINYNLTAALPPITWNGSTVSCSTCGVTTSPLSQFSATTSAQLASKITDYTGVAGSLVFSTSPTIVTPTINTLLTVTANSGIASAPAVTGTLARIIGADGAQARIGVDAYGTGAATAFAANNLRRANGTAASPTAVQSGDLLFGYIGTGYGTSAFLNGGGAGMLGWASSTYTTTGGAELSFVVTPNGGSANGEALRLLNTGQAKFTGSANWSANGSVATALSSIGPTGSHTTVQEWFTVQNASGVTRYIPAF